MTADRRSVGEVHLTGQLRCASDAEAAVVVAQLPEHLALTRAERGCLSFDVVATADPLVWQVDERFESETAFRAHQARVASSAWGRATAGIERRYVVDGLSPVAVSGEATDTERAVLGLDAAHDVLELFSAHTADRLGSGIAGVRFRAGRIDVVWGVTLDDGRDVVVKAHRPPVDVVAVAASSEAKELLRSAGYPCPRPLSGPDRVGVHVLVVEELVADGVAPDGRAPGVRQLLAAGLARHVDVLRDHPQLVQRAGAGPSWCQYEQGPWPVPHDPIVDFTNTPEGFAWLDDLARRASDQVLAHRAGQPVVTGHADWYSGNTAVADGRLVGTFDWELVADTEAVIAGIAAAGYASSSTSGGGLSTPEEAAGFLQDYERARGTAFDDDEQRAAAGVAAWIVAFNARWEVGMPGASADDSATTALARQRGEDFLQLSW